MCLFLLFSFSCVVFPLSAFPFLASPVTDPLVSVSVYIVFVLPYVFVSSFCDVPCYSVLFVWPESYVYACVSTLCVWFALLCRCPVSLLNSLIYN